MTNIDPKDDLPKPAEKEESKETRGPSLNEIAPINRESLQQFRTQQNLHSDGIISFGPGSSLSARGADNRFIGRGFGTGAQHDLPEQIRQSQQQREQNQQAAREFRWVSSGDTVGDVNAGNVFATNNRPFFRYLGVDGLKAPADIRPFPEIKDITDKFLIETKRSASENLSEAERRDLDRSRQQLSEASSADEILSKALHLARLYQHLRYIEEANKALELALGIDPKSPQVLQLLKELEKMHPVDVGITSQAMTEASLTKTTLRKRIAALSGGRVVVLGDLLIDELLEGRPERISREAPVLILEHVDTTLIPGGAANTANNIAALGGTCHAIGVCGKDENAERLKNLLTSRGISHSLVEDPSRPTTVKTRILSKSHSLMQQLLRLDRISHEPISKEIEFALKQRLEQCTSGYKAIVLSDYKSGVITDGIVEACRTIACRTNVLIVVDAQQRFERFNGCALMTPNQPDAEKAVGFKIDSREALIKAGNELLSISGARAVLITRGGDGMVLFERNQTMVELPAFNRSDVFDVTGAGDTVVGTMTLALVTGASGVEAMALGNLAAGIVVRKPGTAVTSQKEMLETLELLNLPS